MTVLLLALLAPALAGSASDVERLEGPIEEEVKAFREVADRFQARLHEHEAGTRQFVDVLEQEERRKISSGYDQLIETLDALEKQQRTLAMERFEDFLVQYPDAVLSDHVRFRLAELHFEIAGEEWLKASEEYYEAQNSAGDDLTLEQLEQLESMPEPKVDLTRPVELYTEIVARNEPRSRDERYEHLDGVYYMLGFCYQEPTHAQYDATKARDTFAALIEATPDSDLANAAHLFLGNHHFDNNDLDDAIAEYQLVYEVGPDSDYYSDSMYQLAWGHYKLSNYDRALQLFSKLLDEALIQEREAGKKSDYAPDARRFMAHSFADIAERRANEAGDDPHAVEVGKAYFSRNAPPEYERDVYVALADVLTKYGRSEEAIESYAYLQQRWKNHPDNPRFQNQIVQLLQSGLFKDPVRAGAARVELTNRYAENSEWWVANRNNPEALGYARDFIEGSLLDVAIELRVRAQESGDPADYLIAARKYREYLQTFPISDDYYDQQWFMADSLFQAEQYQAAEEEYETLIKTRKNHIYGDGAVYRLMDARLRMMLTIGKPDELPAGAIVDRTYETPGGETMQVFDLRSEHKGFIEAADQVLDHSFGMPSEEGAIDYGAEVDQRRAKIMYIPAQILFHHNRYDEARPRLEAIIAEHPREDEASFAAGLLVDSYLNEGDLAQVRVWTSKFATMVLGTSEVADPEGKFASALESTAFKQCMALDAAGDKLGAADAFLVFLQEFPESEHKEFALYNAAVFYQEAGKAERASELFEEFVNKYPDHEWSKRLYFRIASNYEASFNLEKAVHYYEQLVRKFPDDINAPAAVYNASFLKIGLGDHLGAARGFERYASDFPQQNDREKVHFKAGEQYEQVGATQAIRFYRRYVGAYGMEKNPDNALKALYRVAVLHKDQGNTRAYNKQLDKIEAEYDKLMAAQVDLSTAHEARAAAAEAGFRAVQANYDDLIDDELTRNEDKDAKLLNEIKIKELGDFRKQTDEFIAKYRSFEYGTAALYLQGMALFYYADLGLGVKPPAGLNEEEEWAYYELLEESFYPRYYQIEEAAMSHMKEKVIGAAQRQKRHSKWIDEAYATLNKRRPAEYPAIKPEKRGGIDASFSFPIKPMPMDPPKADEGGTP